MPAAAVDAPDISFIMAAHNAAPFVEAAVRSALGQVDATVEVIVVDDASTDDTADIVAAIAEQDTRVRLIRRSAKAGPSVARNEAFGAARGTWLAILDADDLVTPDRSRSLLDLAAATSADMVADNFERFWVDGVSSGVTMIPTASQPYAFMVSVADFLHGNEMFGRDARLGYVKPMFRTAFIRANQISHREDVFIGEDYLLCLSALLADARFVVTSQSFYKYRTRQGSLSWRMDTNHVDKLLAAHRDLELNKRYRDSPEILSASRIYNDALSRAGDMSRIIEIAKQGGWAHAFGRTAVRPHLWRLAARFALGAATRRLAIVAGRSADGGRSA